MEQLNQVAVQEPFVSASLVARCLGTNRRMLMNLDGKGLARVYPIEPDKIPKTWFFRLSEPGVVIDHRHSRPFTDKPGTAHQGNA